MLKLDQCTQKDWKKLEKKPVNRKLITTKPKSTVPKRFTKKMQKRMNTLDKIKGMYNPPRDIEDNGEDGGDDDQFQDDGQDQGGNDDYVSDD